MIPVTYHPGLITEHSLEEMVTDTRPSQYTYRFGSKTGPKPRLEAWFSDDLSQAYGFAGTAIPARAWTPRLSIMRSTLEHRLGARFKSCFVNLYTTGSDGIGWHADDEDHINQDGIIASVSLGSPRRFKVRKGSNGSNGPTVWSQDLGGGDVLIMLSGMQRTYQHSLAKTKRVTGPRWNATFRQ